MLYPGWIDLLVSLKVCFSRKDRSIVEKELRGAPQLLSAEDIVTLSVRSGFDLLLSAVALPKGSEVGRNTHFHESFTEAFIYLNNLKHIQTL